MNAVFRICGNESQPGLQIVENLATPLTAIHIMYSHLPEPFPFFPLVPLVGIVTVCAKD